MGIFTIIFIFIIGSIVGSFLNVCIYRLPREESIVMPRSACPYCHHTLTVVELFPIISFLIQRGRCRNCNAFIRWQYPAVELITAVLFVLVFLQFPSMLDRVILMSFISAMIVVFFIDLEFRIILDIITLPGIVIGLSLSLFPHYPFSDTDIFSRFINSLLGTFIAGGLIYVLAVIGEKIYKKEAMGGGDMKVMAFIGAFFGWRYALAILFLSSLLGAIVGIILVLFKIVKRRDHIPFGPFISIATAIMIFYGKDFIRHFFSIHYNY